MPFSFGVVVGYSARHWARISCVLLIPLALPFCHSLDSGIDGPALFSAVIVVGTTYLCGAVLGSILFRSVVSRLPSSTQSELSTP